MTEQNDSMGQPLPKAPDFMELLMQSMIDRVAARVKAELMPLIKQMIAEDNVVKMDADQVQGLEKFIEHCIEENDRHGGLRIDVEDVNGIDEYIKETLKQATISIDL